MKFSYMVKHNGVYYKPGEDVPADDVKSPNNAEVIEEKTGENAEDDKNIVEEEKPLKKPNIFDKRKEFNYSRSDISKMSTSNLQKLAREYGYDSTLSGAKLKTLFITKYEL